MRKIGHQEATETLDRTAEQKEGDQYLALNYVAQRISRDCGIRAKPLRILKDPTRTLSDTKQPTTLLEFTAKVRVIVNKVEVIVEKFPKFPKLGVLFVREERFGALAELLSVILLISHAVVLLVNLAG